MNIEDILGTQQSEYISSLTKKSGAEKDEETSGSTLPFSWSADKVSISKEAQAAQQSAAGGDQALQGIGEMRPAFACGLRELLRLHGPDHSLRVVQLGRGRLQDAHVGEALLQTRTLFGKGLDHPQVRGRRT